MNVRFCKNQKKPLQSTIPFHYFGETYAPVKVKRFPEHMHIHPCAYMYSYHYGVTPSNLHITGLCPLQERKFNQQHIAN